MYNIEIDAKMLEETILRLEEDNKKIGTIIQYVNDAMKTLNDTKWYAREKNIINEDFMPYLENLQNTVYAGLEEHTIFLRNVIKLHEQQEQMTKTQMENTALGDTVNITREVI